ncbi:hypothetical protein HOY80DRAFT_967657 [Tuber brumale]|nr:hypothetical protein HOY80DRAFT_967657 [Tuber brumale]
MNPTIVRILEEFTDTHRPAKRIMGGDSYSHRAYSISSKNQSQVFGDCPLRTAVTQSNRRLIRRRQSDRHVYHTVSPGGESPEDTSSFIRRAPPILQSCLLESITLSLLRFNLSLGITILKRYLRVLLVNPHWPTRPSSSDLSTELGNHLPLDPDPACPSGPFIFYPTINNRPGQNFYSQRSSHIVTRHDHTNYRDKVNDYVSPPYRSI